MSQWCREIVSWDLFENTSDSTCADNVKMSDSTQTNLFAAFSLLLTFPLAMQSRSYYMLALHV